MRHSHDRVRRAWCRRVQPGEYVSRPPGSPWRWRRRRCRWSRWRSLPCSCGARPKTGGGAPRSPSHRAARGRAALRASAARYDLRALDPAWHAPSPLFPAGARSHVHADPALGRRLVGLRVPLDRLRLSRPDGAAMLRRHPMGVGAGNFPTSCPVTSMSTYGGWSHANVVHNDYLEQLVEGGVAGVLTMVLFAGLMLKRYRPAGEARWVSGAVVTYLVCGIASAVCFRLPFLALLATQVGGGDARRSAGSRSEVMTGSPSARSRAFYSPTSRPGGAAPWPRSPTSRRRSWSSRHATSTTTSSVRSAGSTSPGRACGMPPIDPTFTRQGCTSSARSPIR